MFNPFSVVRNYLIDPLLAPRTLGTLIDLSPSDGTFDIRQHIAAGKALPAGWNVGTQGPIVLLGIRGGTVHYSRRAHNPSIQVMCYATTDSLAVVVANAVMEDLDGKHGREGRVKQLSAANLEAPVQVIADTNPTGWSVGLLFFNVAIRDIP